MGAATDITAPALSDVPEQVLVRWLVAPGDTVSVGQPVALLAVDKGDFELPAPADGEVADLVVEPYATVRSGQRLATVRTPSAGASDPRGAPSGTRSGSRPSPAPPATPARPAPVRPAAAAPADRTTVEPLTRIRRRIAQHMMTSLATSAQLTGAVEVDVSAVMALRNRHKDAFRRRHGVGLSPFTMLARAAVLAATRNPVINAAIDVEAGTVTYHHDVNLGVAVETPTGLLVPNVRAAQDLTTAGLALRIGELAARARNGDLRPDDLAGGTFTVTNTGSLGTLFGTPILSPPNAAILGTYTATRRPVATDGDGFTMRWMSYFCLSYDHQLIDGADAARYLQDVKDTVENHDLEPELGL